MDALNFKILTDELVKIDIASENVPANQSGRAILNFKRAAEVVENFEGEKCDLAFVIFFVIKEAVAPNSMSGHTFD